ncbi:hypothetical protein [Fischerella thermalis]|uniref:hypothetical protein n=1 Tax=Fischerella thermalis TaxID=372787 RepID=UPI0015E15859|nr:hypothetical protein [Fischerella thermalis]
MTFLKSRGAIVRDRIIMKEGGRQGKEENQQSTINNQPPTTIYIESRRLRN